MKKILFVCVLSFAVLACNISVANTADTQPAPVSAATAYRANIESTPAPSWSVIVQQVHIRYTDTGAAMGDEVAIMGDAFVGSCDGTWCYTTYKGMSVKIYQACTSEREQAEYRICQ